MKILKMIAVIAVFSFLTAVISEAGISFRQSNISDPPEQAEPPEVEEPVKIRDYSCFATNSPIVSEMDISARSAILCSSDGTVIYEKRADVQLPMASITKVMSVICALETVKDLSEVVTVPDEAVGIEGSSVYLTKGEKVTYEMLIYSAMLESANDAVTALAITCAGSEDKFVELMNKKASELSMNSTHFCNPHGLSENEHFTTARDYAKLMSYAIENETFRQVIATKKKAYPKLDGSMTRVLSNHNRLLNTYVGMLGGKTGFTKTSGRTLVTAAEKNGTTLICVTLDAPNDWNDHTEMFNVGFDTVKNVTFTADELRSNVPVAAGEKDSVPVRAAGDVSFTVRANEEVVFEVNVPYMVFAPIKSGDEIGRIDFYKNGVKIGDVVLVADESVNEPTTQENKKGFIGKVLEFFKLGS